MARELERRSSADSSAEPAAPRRYEGIASLVFMGFAMLFVAGFVTFRTGGVMRPGNELSVERAVFTSVNALTLTGFQQSIGPDQYRPAGHVAIYGLTLGGTLLTLAGGATAVARIVCLPFSDRQVVTAAFVVTGVATIVGGALLAGVSGPLDGLQAAASAFGNSGLLVGPSPGAADTKTWLVLLPLAFAGGIGLTVLMELFRFFTARRPLSFHAKVVVGMSAGAFVIGTLLLLIVEGNIASFESLSRSAATTINSRSAGLPISDTWPTSNGGKGVLAAMMLVGAGSAGTAGGIKLATLFELFRGTRRTLAGERPGRATGIAIGFVLLYLATLCVGVVVLASAAPQLDLGSVFMLAVSAIANVGISQDPVSTTGPGLYVLSGLMIGGRVLPLAALWWMARTTSDADVAVG